jgi:hypothetical protein
VPLGVLATPLLSSAPFASPATPVDAPQSAEAVTSARPSDSADRLHLIQSQVVFRHGSRVPIHASAAIDTSSGWPHDARRILGKAGNIEVRHALVRQPTRFSCVQ